MPNGTPKQLANLTSWEPGQSGNPAGCSRGVKYREEVQRLLEDALQDERDGMTRAERIIDRIVSLAERGSPWACKLVLDRLLPAENRLNVGVTTPFDYASAQEDADEIRASIFAKLTRAVELDAPTIPAELPVGGEG